MLPTVAKTSLTIKLTHYAAMPKDFNTEFMEIAMNAKKLYTAFCIMR